MRTRSKTTVKLFIPGQSTNVNATTYYCSGAPSVDTNGPFSGSDVTAAYEQEHMMDDVSPGKGPKSCVHNKRVFLSSSGIPDYSGSLSPTSWATWFGVNQSVRIGLAASTLESYSNWSLNTPGAVPQLWDIPANISNESSLIEDCFEKARQLKADGLLNLVEANQIWPSLTSLTQCLPNMAKHWRQIRKVIKTASGAYLAWKFGVSPILSDIMSIHRYLPKLGSDIRRFGLQAKQRFSAVALIQGTQFNSSSVFDGLTEYKPVSEVIEQPVIRYVLVVEPNRTYHSDAFKALDVCMQRFTSTPASMAWELVPFSFVVDWFVDLRGALRTIDRLLGFEPFKIISFTRSHSYHVSTRVFRLWREPCNNTIIMSLDAGSCQFKHYERTLAPTTATLPLWKPRFGKNQAGISAALIAQKLFRA